MNGVNVGALLGGIQVHTTNYRGHTPEELAEFAIDKIIYVGKESHPLIQQQAEAYKAQIKQILIQYLRQAQQSERTTICGTLVKQGHEDLANLIRSI